MEVKTRCECFHSGKDAPKNVQAYVETDHHDTTIWGHHSDCIRQQVSQFEKVTGEKAKTIYKFDMKKHERFEQDRKFDEEINYRRVVKNA